MAKGAFVLSYPDLRSITFYVLKRVRIKSGTWIQLASSHLVEQRLITKRHEPSLLEFERNTFAVMFLSNSRLKGVTWLDTFLDLPSRSVPVDITSWRRRKKLGRPMYHTYAILI